MDHDVVPPDPAERSTGPGWEAVSALFAEALDVPESDRAAWLSSREGVDPDVIREVESLLACFGRADGFLDAGG